MKTNRKIFLIGMMGSGKSVTAKSLASMLQASFVDLDRSIEASADLSVSEIFKKHGEAYFRDLESKELQGLENLSGTLVVATGGGIVLRPKNTNWMKHHGEVVYLQASLEVLWQRVKGNQNRPLLAMDDPRAVLEKISAERELLYQNNADISIQTDGRSADDVAQEIRSKLNL